MARPLPMVDPASPYVEWTTREPEAMAIVMGES